MSRRVHQSIEDLTSRPSPILRWVLAPCVLAMAGFIVLGTSSEYAAEGGGQRMAGYTAGVWMLLLAIGAWHPVRHRWALRAFAALIPMACVWYLYDTLAHPTPEQGVLPSDRSDTHPLNAVMAALVFGVPALGYAWTGRMKWWVPTPDLDGPEVEGLERLMPRASDDE